MDIDDIAFGMDVLDRVTPHDDLYDNITPDVFDHIVTIIAQKDNIIYMPTCVTVTPSEPEFIKLLNQALLARVNNIALTKVSDKVERDILVSKNRLIFRIAKSTLESLRKAKEKDASIDNSAYIDEKLKPVNIDEASKRYIKNQVLKNMALDRYLDGKEELLNELVKTFNITREG